MCNIFAILLRYLSTSGKSLKSSGLNGDSSRDLYDAGAAPYRLSCQGNWELVVMRVNHKSVDEDYNCIGLKWMFIHLPTKKILFKIGSRKNFLGWIRSVTGWVKPQEWLLWVSDWLFDNLTGRHLQCHNSEDHFRSDCRTGSLGRLQ